MNCLKKGFRFLGDVILKKIGPRFLGGIKKKIMKKKEEK